MFRRHCVVPVCFNVDFQTAVVNHYVCLLCSIFCFSVPGLATPNPTFSLLCACAQNKAAHSFPLESIWQVNSYRLHTWVDAATQAMLLLELQVHMHMDLVQLVIVFQFMVMFVMVAMSEVIDPGLIRDATDPTQQTGFIVKNRWLDLDVLGGQLLLDQSKSKEWLDALGDVSLRVQTLENSMRNHAVDRCPERLHI